MGRIDGCHGCVAREGSQETATRKQQVIGRLRTRRMRLALGLHNCVLVARETSKSSRGMPYFLRLSYPRHIEDSGERGWKFFLCLVVICEILFGSSPGAGPRRPMSHKAVVADGKRSEGPSEYMGK